MDEKDLEKGKKKEMTYEVDLKTPIISEPRAAYEVDDMEAEYKTFQNLPDTMRVEFTASKIYYLAAPNNKPQELLMRLSARFYNYLHGKSCKVYAAPFDVKIDFDFDKLSKETLQPDLLVVCDDEKLSKQGLNGASDLVIEILSPSDPGRDKVFKYNKYLAAGVKEYWIVDPIKEEVVVNILNAGRYDMKTYFKGDVIKPTVLDDLYVNVTDFFEGRKGREIEEVEMEREEEWERQHHKDIVNVSEMIQDNLPIETIVRYSGLSLEVIEEVMNNLKSKN